jgi:hypothetical protein
VGNNERRSSFKRPKYRWGMLVLKYILMDWDGRRWTEFTWFRKEKSVWNLK